MVGALLDWAIKLTMQSNRVGAQRLVCSQIECGLAAANYQSEYCYWVLNRVSIARKIS